MKNKFGVISIVLISLLFGLIASVNAQSSTLGAENENENEDVSTTSESNPFSCTTRSIVDGFIFVDTNNDKKMQTGEEAVEKGIVSIYYRSNDGDELLLTVQSDKTGKWSGELCPGTYTVKLDTTKLSYDKKISGDSTQSITVKANTSTNNINFPLISTTAGLNPLIIIGMILLIVALLLVILLLTRKSHH